MLNHKDVQLTRKSQLTPKILIIDGLPGCGKTMMSPIVSALDRVEKLTYSYEMEMMCQLWALGKIDIDAAKVMIRTFTDMKLYTMMMGREVNFRIKDLSSAFMDVEPWRYIKRIFGPGDEAVPAKVLKEQPILHLTTHHLLGIGSPLFEALQDKLVMVNVVRHPLYMVKQQSLNMERLVADVRYFFLHMEYQGHELPFWTKGWEELFLKSNAVERAVYSIVYMSQHVQATQDSLPAQWKDNVLTIPFEDFVVMPDAYMKKLTNKLATSVTPLTLKMMRRQKVPRKKIADGINLPIYRRCGWQPSTKGINEGQEFADRRDWVAKRINPAALSALDKICKDYERAYMGGEQLIPGRN